MWRAGWESWWRDGRYLAELVNLSFFVGKKARRGQKTLTWFTQDEGSTLRA